MVEGGMTGWLDNAGFRGGPWLLTRGATWEAPKGSHFARFAEMWDEVARDTWLDQFPHKLTCHEAGEVVAEFWFS